ncbi:MAG: BTAD domain-containing putative transcriptional regulator [Desulfuromonadaceae bacterium]|nr:BTAD domain-containing putative transcriptional regulator [Desulfuromonadaceae bacterium]
MDGYHAKLLQPDLPRIYPRARLFEHLDTLFEKPVTWISAPPGSGKTTLAASYLALRAYPTLWYRVDSSDADIASFFYYLALCGNQSIKQNLPLLTPEYVPNVMMFAHRFFEQFFSLLQPNTTLIFDNYQELPEDSPLHSILYQVLEAAPPHRHIIFLSRGAPPVPIAALKTKRRLATLGMTELQFTQEETAGFAAQHGHVLSASCIETIHEKTHGWPAGVILMLESIREGIATAGTVTFARQNDDLFAYFSTELLARCDAPLRDFLLRTSLLPRMTTEMAVRLTSCANGGRLLAKLHRSGWFTEKHSGQTEFFSYHPLFRDFLLNEATNSLPAEELAALQGQAAMLLQEAGDLENAFALFLQAGNWPGVIGIVATHAASLLAQGRSATLENWLCALPADLLANNPWLLYWKGCCRLFVSPGESRSLFYQAFTMFQENDDLIGTMLAWSGAVDSLMFEVDDLTYLDPWIDWLDAWSHLQTEFPNAAVEAKVATTMALALTWRKPHHREISTWIERALTLTERHPDMTLRLQVLISAVNYYCWMGDYDRYVFVVEEAGKFESSAAITPAIRIIWKSMAAIIGGSSPDIYDPLKAAEEGLSLAKEHGIHVWDLILLSQAAYGALTEGNLKLAGSFLAKIEPMMTNTGRANQAQYHGIRGWHALLVSDFAKARAHAEKFKELTRITGIPIPEIISRHLLAQVKHESGDTEGAWQELYATREMINEIGSLFMLHISLLLEARFALDQGREQEGMDALCRAITLGKERRYETLLFRWPASKLAELYARALEKGFETEYVCSQIKKLSLQMAPPPVTLQQWPWEIKIHTLGRFGLIKEGIAVRFAGKIQQKPLEMLKALIALGGRDVTEERLCDELWPDADGDAAHKAFSVNLVRLRRLIGQDRALIFQDGRLSINDRCCWVDTVAFERMAADAEALWNSGQGQLSSRVSAEGYDAERGARAAKLTEKAITIYSGHFLSAESAYSWGISTRERLRGKFIRLVEALGRYWEETGRLDKAIACHQKGLETDDLIEEFYQHLMVCHLALGQQAKGVELYRRCRMKLAAELGLKPSSKTEAIYKTLLN